MKKVTVIMAFLVIQQVSAQSFFDAADSFFERYVIHGQVKYAEIKSDPALLDQLVASIARFNLEAQSGDIQKAFLINTYNLLVIKGIIDEYPVEGPLKIPGFFDRIPFLVSGEKLTLNELEKEVLFKKFNDPRMHFILVCAAKGCPPLASSAYRPEQLTSQIQKRTEYVLNLDSFIRVSNKGGVSLSKIFEWYEGDFGGSEQVVDFINQYRNQKIPKNKVDYYQYDWSLNE